MAVLVAGCLVTGLSAQPIPLAIDDLSSRGFQVSVPLVSAGPDGHFFAAPLSPSGHWAEFAADGAVVDVPGQPWIDGLPGELQGPMFVIPMAGDTVLVVDSRRFVWMDRSGKYLGARLNLSGHMTDFQHQPDGSVLIVGASPSGLVVQRVRGIGELTTIEPEPWMAGNLDNPRFIGPSRLWLHLDYRLVDLESGEVVSVTGLPEGEKVRAYEFDGRIVLHRVGTDDLYAIGSAGEAHLLNASLAQPNARFVIGNPGLVMTVQRAPQDPVVSSVTIHPFESLVSRTP